MFVKYKIGDFVSKPATGICKIEDILYLTPQDEKIINFIIYGIGEEKIANLVVDVPIVGTLISALIGIIPNCASSIILTELFLGKIITMGQMIAGLLVNSGIGILVLFKVNKNVKENLKILGILYIIGITSGILLDLIA